MASSLRSSQPSARSSSSPTCARRSTSSRRRWGPRVPLRRRIQRRRPTRPIPPPRPRAKRNRPNSPPQFTRVASEFWAGHGAQGAFMALGSFSAGLSGLSANSVYLNVIGNNLANINTVGFKSSAVTFEDLVSQTLGGSNGDLRQVGLGVSVGSIAPVFSQGSIENTRESTNVAIQGAGFFVINGPNNSNAYTRAGNFTLSSDGTLVSSDGWRVQGYTQTDPVTGAIITTGALGNITLPPGVLRE